MPVSRPPEEVIEASDKQAEVAPHIQDDFNDIDEDELKEAASKAGMTAFHVLSLLTISSLPLILHSTGRWFLVGLHTNAHMRGKNCCKARGVIWYIGVDIE